MIAHAILAALAVAAPSIPIEPPGKLPGWTPNAPDYGPKLVELLQRGVDAAPGEYRRLTEAEKKCWWATQMYELLTADYMATGLRLAVQPPDPTGPGAAISRSDVSAGWLKHRRDALYAEAEKYETLMTEHCPRGGNGSGYSAFDDASFYVIYSKLNEAAPARAGLFDARMVVPAGGWSPETLLRATLELRKRKQKPQDGLACGC